MFVRIALVLLLALACGSVHGADTPSRDVTLVFIDDATIKHYGTFPWTRDKYAAFIDAVYAHYSPAVVFVSIVLCENSKENPEGDQALFRAIKGKKNLFFNATIGGDQTNPAPDKKLALPAGAQKDLPLPSALGGLFPLPQIQASGGLMSIHSVIPDKTEMYNDYPAAYLVGKDLECYLSGPLMQACAYLKLDFREARLSRTGLTLNKKNLKLDERGFFAVDFGHSFDELNCLEVVNHSADKAKIDGRLVLLKCNATGWRTTLPTRKSLSLNSAYFDANAMQTAIDALR